MGLFSMFRKRNSKKFRVTYSAFIANPTHKYLSTTLVLPMPTSYPFQKLRSLVTARPLPEDIAKEPKFENRYIWWLLELKAKEEQHVRLQFDAEVFPTQTKNVVQFQLSDYASTKISPALLASNDYIQSNNPEIQKTANELTEGTSHLGDILQKLNTYVIERLEYGNPISGLYTTQEAMKNKKVDCGGYDVLFCALCRALGIPATIVSGFWAGYAQNTMHAWVTIQLPDGTWTTADPSIEALTQQKRTKKRASLFSTPADRITLSMGEDLEVLVGAKPYATGILQNPILTENTEDLTVEVRFETKKLA